MKRIMKTPDYPCDLHSKIIDCIYHGPGHPRYMYTLNFIKLPLFCRHIVLQKSASYLNFSKARASVDWCCGNTPFAWEAHGLDVVFWFSSGIHEMDGSYIKILHIDYKNPTHKMWCTCTSNISTNQKKCHFLTQRSKNLHRIMLTFVFYKIIPVVCWLECSVNLTI